MDRTEPYSNAPKHDETAAIAAPLDFDRAVGEFAGNRALVERLLDRFLEELEGQVPALQTALAVDDWEALRRAAHRTRGGAANLTAVPTASAAERIEGSAESCDRVGAEAGLARLREEIERLGRFVSTLHDAAPGADCPTQGRRRCEF